MNELRERIRLNDIKDQGTQFQQDECVAEHRIKILDSLDQILRTLESL